MTCRLKGFQVKSNAAPLSEEQQKASEKLADRLSTPLPYRFCHERWLSTAGSRWGSIEIEGGSDDGRPGSCASTKAALEAGPALGACYDEAIARKPNLETSLQFRVKEGLVSITQRGAMRDRSLETCATSAVRTLAKSLNEDLRVLFHAQPSNAGSGFIVNPRR
jgi:hypothetical protein